MKRQQKTEEQTGMGGNQPKFHMHQVLVRFRPQLTRMQQQRLFSQSVIQILSDPICFIRDNYYEQHWKQILPYIQESYCRRFFLMGIGENSILREISMIKFCCLKQIDLSSNKITNLQLIPWIKLPHVKSIVLKNNCITNISSLRKGKWKDIEEINLQGNHFLQYGRINQIYTSPNIIDSFDIGFYSGHTICSIQDIGVLYAKFMTNNESVNIMKNIQLFQNGNDYNHQQEQQRFRENNQINPQQQQHQTNTIITLGKRRILAIKRKFQKPQR